VLDRYRVKLVGESFVILRISPELGQKEIMKYTTVKISEILNHPTKRMDAKYWIKKKLKKEKSCKPQAPSSKLDSGSGI